MFAWSLAMQQRSVAHFFAASVLGVVHLHYHCFDSKAQQEEMCNISLHHVTACRILE